MTHRHRLLLLLLLVCGLLSEAQVPDYAPGRVMAKLTSGATLWPDWQITDGAAALPAEVAALQAEFGFTAVRRPFRTHSPVLDLTYDIRLPAGREQGLIAALQSLPAVEYAERVPLYTVQYTPNDINFLQWHLNKIDAADAWDTGRGASRVVLAVVDDAMRITHDDLAAVVWTNPNESLNGLDDDLNGIIDDLHGADLADDDNDPNPPAGADNVVFSHGTHVSGIAAAATDNGTGIASIGFGISLMPVKTKFDTTIGSIGLEATMEGVDYAIATGADVINMSFGGGGASSTWQALIDAGYFSGVTFVGAAGNNNEFKQFFPAAYNHVISVGSTDWADQKSSFSNWHYSVDVMAPGSGIYSTVAGSNSSYDFMSGTSMSSPLAAGLCALLLSADSTLSPSEIEDCLTAGCENIDAVNPDYVGFMGFGRINAAHSMACAAGVGVQDAATFAGELGLPYPQPAEGLVTLPLQLDSRSWVRLTVLGLDGRLVHQVQEGDLPAGQHFLQWDASEMPAGLYLGVCEVDGARLVRRVAVR